MDDSGTLPSYSNFCRVTATPEEVILDFGLNPQPFATGRQDVKANQRIVMNFYTAKRLLTALGMTIQRHEGTFGSIELDVRRRADQPAPAAAVSPARPRWPPGRRRVIRSRTDLNTDHNGGPPVANLATGRAAFLFPCSLSRQFTHTSHHRRRRRRRALDRGSSSGPRAGDPQRDFPILAVFG